MTDNNEIADEITGTVEQIIFNNPDNAYSVIDLFDDHGELITAVGIMPYVNEGDTVMLAGKWITHPSFGRQFSVSFFDRTLPAEEGDILRYLVSGNVKGIGPKTAVKIVGRYGGETFDIIENHPEWLAEFPTITLKKAHEISKRFKEQFGVRNIMMLAQGIITASNAMRIFKIYKDRSAELIRNNPYILCETVSGISFEKSDRLAMSLGIEHDSVNRIKSGIMYMLNYNCDKNGHTYLPYDRLIAGTAELLDVENEKIVMSIDALAHESKIIITELEGTKCVYSKKYYDAENYCAEKLTLLNAMSVLFSGHDKRLFIDRIELENGITYGDMQRQAIESAIEHNVMVLTGGPGTGKTTVIKAVIRIFETLGLKVALAAPTGRAAKRMSEATSMEAKTIHRLLEMGYRDDDLLEFRRNENDTLDQDVIIVDEASMLGIDLLNSLLKAVSPGSRLLLIGDSSQLASVGAGNVLADIINSGKFCTICLKEIFRQAKESLIVTNAHAVNNGEFPELTVHDKDFFFLERKNDIQIAETVASLYSERLPKTYGKDVLRKIQVISPTRNGNAGTVALNELLQQKLNPPSPDKKERKAHSVIFREGDRVMQIKNNYEIVWEKGEIEGSGIFNGDIGVIESIDLVNETMELNFDGRKAEYDFTMLDELEHSYAITVHKSQGSEYPTVIIPLCRASTMLLTRNLLYTAMTRAKNMVILVGEKRTVSEMIDNNRQNRRYTGLCEMLTRK